MSGAAVFSTLVDSGDGAYEAVGVGFVRCMRVAKREQQADRYGRVQNDPAAEESPSDTAPFASALKP